MGNRTCGHRVIAIDAPFLIRDNEGAAGTVQWVGQCPALAIIAEPGQDRPTDEYFPAIFGKNLNVLQ